MFCLNIILTFFTAKQMDIEWKYDLKIIAKAYSIFFVFDCLSTIPSLVTFYDDDYYYFKIARFVHFKGF